MKLKSNLKINDNGFVFDPVTGESYTLNPIGLEMLKLINEGRNKPEIKKHFLNEYALGEWEFEKAFLDFLAVLEKNHLINHG